MFGAGHRVRGDRRQGRSRLNSHVWLWCRWGRTSVDAFQHPDGERKLDASAQRRAPGGAGSRPRSPVSARSFACLSTHPIESSRTLRFLTGQLAARPRPPCPCWCSTARSSRAEALQVYRFAQPVLRSELGLEPCRSLRRLHQRTSLPTGSSISSWRADGGHEAPCGIRCVHSAGVRPGDRVKPFSAPSTTWPSPVACPGIMPDPARS
ncbi:BTAD domain-containing putative transcriptional regulator [Streptomyces sp. NPDC002917]|uniref:BTAD domain-containing putative transcriptional regulator n=1 Tax=Streptomyces sp. NPDC002917 TaxID=3364671 RepID=UPI0036AF5E73